MRRRSLLRMRVTGCCLLLLSAVIFIYQGMIVELAPREAVPTPYQKPSGPTPERSWTQWLAEDSSALDSAYFIRNLDETKKALCNGIYREIAAFAQEIILPEPIHIDVLSDVMWLIKYDCPELFQISGEYTYYVRPDEPDMAFSLRPAYWMTEPEYIEAMAAVEARLTDFQNWAEGLDAFSTQKLIYDSLMGNCVYQETGPHTGTAYGALVLGRARCEGYAQALNIALRRAGMDCVILTGEARESRVETGEGALEKLERHAWNAVRIGGSFYQLDATWDDSDGNIPGGSAYAYFNVTDAEMRRTRTLDPIYNRLTLPPCDDMAYNYFVQAGAYITAGEPVREALLAMLERMLDEGAPLVLGKLEMKEQYDEFMLHLRDWMGEWGGKLGFTSGSYSLTTYPDNRVFCITNIRYE